MPFGTSKEFRQKHPDYEHMESLCELIDKFQFVDRMDFYQNGFKIIFKSGRSYSVGITDGYRTAFFSQNTQSQKTFPWITLKQAWSLHKKASITISNKRRKLWH